MASIQMNMGTETEINATPNKDGLILFDTTNKKIILDNNGTREVLTKHIEANPNLNGAEQLENLKVNGEVLNFLPVDISNVEKDGEEISDILEDKYDTEGDYNTTVDKCTDLTRVAPVTDTAPYIYRQTPVKESFKALMKKIVGASVVWNQMIRPIASDYWGSYNSSVSFSNGVCSLMATAQGGNVSVKSGYRPNILANHIYIGSVIVKASENYNNVRLSWASGIKVIDTNVTASWTKYIVVFKYNSDYANSINAVIDRNTSDFKEIQFKEFWQTDLTTMFGTTIADYVYTLETSQSGSGIAWLQSYGFFTEDYYTYKQNKLESGCVSAKKIVETNQAKMDNANNPNRSSFSYTKETAQSIVGTKTVGGGNFFAQFEIDLISGKTYTFSFGKFETNGTENANVNVYIYSDRLWGTSIKANWNVSKDGSTWTSTYNGKAYVGIFTTASVDTVLELDGFMASISGSTSFEPYTETTYPISPITLRGLFKLSIDKLTVDGDEYNADGSVTRKYEQRAYQSGDESLANAITDGTNTIVKLATPTTEQTTPFTETEIVGSTEEFIDYEVAQSNRDVAIPVGTETDYYQSYNIPPIPFTDCYLSASNQILGWISNS